MRDMAKATIATAVLAATTLLAPGWSEERGISLSVESAQARVGRPLTPMSGAGVARRQYRRAAYGAGVVGAGLAGAAAIGAAPYYAGAGYYGGNPYYSNAGYYAGGPYPAVGAFATDPWPAANAYYGGPYAAQGSYVGGPKSTFWRGRAWYGW
jgi:hypothetical protein